MHLQCPILVQPSKFVVLIQLPSWTIYDPTLNSPERVLRGAPAPALPGDTAAGPTTDKYTGGSWLCGLWVGLVWGCRFAGTFVFARGAEVHMDVVHRPGYLPYVLPNPLCVMGGHMG